MECLQTNCFRDYVADIVYSQDTPLFFFLSFSLEFMLTYEKLFFELVLYKVFESCVPFLAGPRWSSYLDSF